jgi:hypothetical protein
VTSNHSAILGGSNAGALMACPASFQEILRAPFSDGESAYAAEGTALHEAIANLLITGRRPAQIHGLRFYGHTIDDRLQELLEIALAALVELKQQFPGERFRIACVEKELPLPGVTGAFGGVDLVLLSRHYAVIIDWKFGFNPVHAIYRDAERGDTLNPQGVFYALCARAYFGRRFRGKRIIIAIIQPQLQPALSWAETDDAELDQFHQALLSAYVEALGRNPHRERGEHCRWRPCKATCELWTGPVFDLAVLDPARAALRASANKTSVSDYAKYLGHAMELARLAEFWIDEIQQQAHALAETGAKIPGWRLVSKRKIRSWNDPEIVPGALAAAGALAEEIYSPPTLKSVAQVEKAFKKRGIKLDESLVVAQASGTTLAPADDERPDADREAITRNLKQALKAL